MNRNLELLEYILQQLQETIDELPEQEFKNTRNSRLQIYEQLRSRYPQLVTRLENETNGTKDFEKGIIADLISAISDDLNQPQGASIPPNRDELVERYIASLNAPQAPPNPIAQAYNNVMQARQAAAQAATTTTTTNLNFDAFATISDATQHIINPENIQFPADYSDKARDNKVVADDLATRITEIVAENSYGSPDERARAIEDGINQAYKDMYNVDGVTKKHQEVIQKEAQRLAALPVDVPVLSATGDPLTDEIAKKIAVVTVGQQVSPEQIVQTAQTLTPEVKAALNDPDPDKTPDQQIAEAIKTRVQSEIAPLPETPAVDRYLRTSTNRFKDIQTTEEFREDLPPALQVSATQSVNQAVSSGTSEAAQAYQLPQVQRALQYAIKTTADTMQVAADPRDNAATIQEAARSIMTQEVQKTLKDDPVYQQLQRDKAGYEQLPPSLEQLVQAAAGGMAGGFIDKQAEHAVALTPRQQAAVAPRDAIRSTANNIVAEVERNLPDGVSLSKQERQNLYNNVFETIDDNTYQLQSIAPPALKEKIATRIEESLQSGSQTQSFDLSDTLNKVERTLEPTLTNYNYELTKKAAESSIDYLEQQARAAFPTAQTPTVKAEDFPAPPAPTQEVIMTGRGDRAARTFDRAAELIVNEITPTLNLDAQEQADLRERLELTLTGMADTGKTRQEMQQRVAEIVAENTKGVDQPTLDKALRQADFMAEGQAKVSNRQFKKTMAGPEDAYVYDTNAGQEPVRDERAAENVNAILNKIDTAAASKPDQTIYDAISAVRVAEGLYYNLQQQANQFGTFDPQTQQEINSFINLRMALAREMLQAKDDETALKLRDQVLNLDRQFLIKNQDTVLTQYYNATSGQSYRNQWLKEIEEAKESFREKEQDLQEKYLNNKITQQDALDQLKALHKDSQSVITQNLIQMQMQLDNEAIKKSDEEKINALVRVYEGNTRGEQRAPATREQLRELKRGLDETNWYDRGNYLSRNTDEATKLVEKQVGEVLKQLSKDDPFTKDKLRSGGNKDFTASDQIKRDVAIAVMTDLANTTNSQDVQYSILSTLKSEIEKKVSTLTGKQIKLDPGSTAGDLVADAATGLSTDKKVQAAAAMQSLMPIIPHMNDEIEPGDLYGLRESIREMVVQDYQKGMRDIERGMKSEIERGVREYQQATTTPQPDNTSPVVLTYRGEDAARSFDKAADLIVKEITPTLGLDISKQYELREQMELILVGMADAGKTRAEMRERIQKLVQEHAGNVPQDVLDKALRQADFMAGGQTKTGTRAFKKAMSGSAEPITYSSTEVADQNSFDRTANNLASKAAKTFSMDSYDEGELRRQISETLANLAAAGKSPAELQAAAMQLIQQAAQQTSGGQMMNEMQNESMIVLDNEAVYLNRKTKKNQFYRGDAKDQISSLLAQVRSANPSITDEQLDAIAENAVGNVLGRLKTLPVQARDPATGVLLFDKEGQPILESAGKDAEGNDIAKLKIVDDEGSIFAPTSIMKLSASQMNLLKSMKTPAERLKFLSGFDELRKQQIYSAMSTSLIYELKQFGVYTPELERKLNNLVINGKKMNLRDAIQYHLEQGYSIEHFLKQYKDENLSNASKKVTGDDEGFYYLSKAKNPFSNNIDTIEALLDPKTVERYLKRKQTMFVRDIQKTALGAVGIDKDSHWTTWLGSMVNGSFDAKLRAHNKNLGILSTKYKMDVAEIARTGIKPKNISLLKSLELDRAIRNQRGLDVIKAFREKNPYLAMQFDKKAKIMMRPGHQFSAEFMDYLLSGTAGIKQLPRVVAGRLINGTVNTILTKTPGFKDIPGLRRIPYVGKASGLRDVFIHNVYSGQILFVPYENFKARRDEAKRQLKEATWNSRPVTFLRTQGNNLKSFVWNSKPVTAVRNQVNKIRNRIAKNAAVKAASTFGKAVSSLATKISARLSMEGILAMLPTGVSQVLALVLAADSFISSIPILGQFYTAFKKIMLLPVKIIWKTFKTVVKAIFALWLYMTYRMILFIIGIIQSIATAAAVGGLAGSLIGLAFGGVPGFILGGFIGTAIGSLVGIGVEVGKAFFRGLSNIFLGGGGGLAIGTGGALSALMPGWLSGFFSTAGSLAFTGLITVPMTMLSLVVSAPSAIAAWLTSMGTLQAAAVVSTAATLGLTMLFSPSYLGALMESLRNPLDKATGELATLAYPLQITKTADKLHVNQNNDQIHYTITVSGPACAPILAVKDKIPDTLKFDPSVPPSFGQPLDALIDKIDAPTGPDADNTLIWLIHLKKTDEGSCAPSAINTGDKLTILDPSKTAATLGDMQALLSSYPGGSFKPMKDTAQYFIDGQQKYGINPLFIAGIDAFESTMGIGGIGRPATATTGCYNASNLKSPNTDIPQKYGGTRTCTNPDFWRFPSYQANIGATYEWIQTYHVTRGETDVDSIMARYQGTDDKRAAEVAIIKCTMRTKRVCSDASNAATGSTTPTFTATLTFAGLANAPTSKDGPQGDGCITNIATAQIGAGVDSLSSTGGVTTSVGPAKCNDLQSLPQGTIAEVKAFMCTHPTIKICPTLGTKYPPNSDWTREQLEALWIDAQKVYQAEPYRSYAVGNYGIEVQRSRCYVYNGATNCPAPGGDTTQGFNQGVDASYATMQFSPGVTPKVILIMNTISSINGIPDILQYLYAHEIGHSAQHGTASGGIGDRNRNPANQPVLALNEVVSLYGAPTTYCVAVGQKLKCGSGLEFENNADAISYYMTNGEIGGNYRLWKGNTNNLKIDHPNTYNALKDGFFANGVSGGPQEYGP